MQRKDLNCVLTEMETNAKKVLALYVKLKWVAFEILDYPVLGKAIDWNLIVSTYVHISVHVVGGRSDPMAMLFTRDAIAQGH